MPDTRRIAQVSANVEYEATSAQEIRVTKARMLAETVYKTQQTKAIDSVGFWLNAYSSTGNITDGTYWIGNTGSSGTTREKALYKFPIENLGPYTTILRVRLQIGLRLKSGMTEANFNGIQVRALNREFTGTEANWTQSKIGEPWNSPGAGNDTIPTYCSYSWQQYERDVREISNYIGAFMFDVTDTYNSVVSLGYENFNALVEMPDSYPIAMYFQTPSHTSLEMFTDGIGPRLYIDYTAFDNKRVTKLFSGVEIDEVKSGKVTSANAGIEADPVTNAYVTTGLAGTEASFIPNQYITMAALMVEVRKGLTRMDTEWSANVPPVRRTGPRESKKENIENAEVSSLYERVNMAEDALAGNVDSLRDATYISWSTANDEVEGAKAQSETEE